VALGAAPVKEDRDGDAVLDDLEARLEGQPLGTEVSVIVTLTAPASAERVRRLEAEVGDFGLTDRFSIIDGFAATVTKRQVRALSRTPGVSQVEENSRVHALNASAQDAFGVTEARLDAPSLDGEADGNPATYSSSDLVAAVIDTGIDAAHPDLDEGKVIGFKDFVGGETAPYDDNGHGTHVAGTIAGEGDNSNPNGKGVAPSAGLVGVKVLNSAGSGTMADVTAGIDWVVQNNATLGVEAINLSLGTSGCSDGTDATSQAVNNANAAGIVVAVAAGNSGPGTCTIGSPGAAAKAITVGAMADTGVNGFKQAYFSSRGKTADGRIKPDVSAPGVSITSADAGTTGYVAMSGTSMATPFAAGTALLIRDADPARSSDQVKADVMETAVDWGRGGDSRTAGTSGVDTDYGAGRLDAYAAIRSAGGAGAALTSPPPAPAHELRDGTLSGTGAQAEYELNVTNTSFPIAATLIHPSISGSSASSPDFDLYLIDPNGSQVAAAETARRQDELGYQPTVTGTYRLRVRSYSGSGPFFVDISAGLGADTTPPTVTGNSPTGAAVAPDANVSVTFSEPMDTTVDPASYFTVAPTSDPLATVAGSYSWSGNTLTLDPATDLAKGVQYTATVGTAAKDKAQNNLAAAHEWTFTTTSVSTFTAFASGSGIETGTRRAGDHTRLVSDNDSYFQVNSTTSGTRVTSWYGAFTGISNAASNLRLTYKGKNSRTCTQSVALRNWTTSGWTQLGGTNSVGSTEAQAERTHAGSLADYVSGDSGPGELDVRIRCTRGSGSFFASGDLLKIVYDAP
jgi:serine protease AprX